MALITLVNRYQLREQLSHKAGRQTFIAQDLQTDRLVIIKILSFGQGFQWDDHKLFEREASTLKNLDHQAIPRYLDYFEVDESDIRGFALVQTYIQAPTLETAIEEGRKFSEAEAIELANRILDILTYLHELHPPIVHRDIKPSNILIGNRSGHSIGEVYLVDFGSVQAVASKESGTMTIVGSYGYIPLEQFGGQTTRASDLYSLGMTLIYLLTGTHPAELTQVNGRVKFTAEISDRFRRWLEKIAHPHLDRRFDSAKSAKIALRPENSMSFGNFEHLKPASTEVSLTYFRDSISITWQDIDREKMKMLDCISSIPKYLAIFLFIANIALFFIAFLSGSAWLTNLIPITFYGMIFTAFILMPVGAMLAAITKSFIKEIFTLYTLRIDERHISHEKTTNKSGYTFTQYLDSHGRVIRHSSVYKLLTYHIKLIIYRIENTMRYGRFTVSVMDDRTYRLKRQTENSKTDLLSCHPRSQIEIVAYNPAYIFDGCLDIQGQELRRGTVTVVPKLFLRCGDFEYRCPDRLSHDEYQWLGKELSDFLDLELQVIYPTPKLDFFH